MAEEEYTVLDLSGEPPKKKEEKKASFFESKMENIPKEAFKKGAVKAPGGKQQPAAEKKKEDDSRRIAAIRLYNKYLRSEHLVRVLHESGMQCALLPHNASLETAQALLEQIDSILSQKKCHEAAKNIMRTLNKASEFMIPDLKFGSPSLSEAYEIAIETEGSQPQLDLEELSLHIPVTTSFWPRFFMGYASFVYDIWELKKRGKAPVQQQEKYQAFEDLNERFEADDL